MDLEVIKRELIRLLRNIDNEQWNSTELIIEFPPFLNKGFNTMPSFWDMGGNRLRIFLKYDDDFNKTFYSFVRDINSEGKYNQINFSAKKDDYDNADIKVFFNEVLDSTFQSKIPKSKRGKTIPWWNNPEELKGLIAK